MPSILSQTNFPVTARPGIYGYIDASQLAGGVLSSGNLAIVGEFPNFEQITTAGNEIPNQFFSRLSMTSFDPVSVELALLAQCAFSPSDDPDTDGGAVSVRVVNVQPTTQATHAIGPLTLGAKGWGRDGNR